MMSLTFGLFTQVSGSGPLGPLVCSVVAGGTSHFYLFFSVIFWHGLIFWYDNIGLWLGF